MVTLKEIEDIRQNGRRIYLDIFLEENKMSFDYLDLLELLGENSKFYENYTAQELEIVYEQYLNDLLG